MKRCIFLFLLLALFGGGVSADSAAQASVNLQEKIQLTIDEGSLYVQPEGEGLLYAGTSDGASFTVSTDDLGVLTAFSLDVPRQAAGLRLPALTKEQAVQTATSFVTRNANDIVAQLDIFGAACTFVSSPYTGYSVRFSRQVNGVPYGPDGVTVLVDGDSGRVIGYQRTITDDASFAPAPMLLNEEAAQLHFRHKIGLQLQYHKALINGRPQAYLVYAAPPDKLLHAVTGEVLVAQSAPGGAFDVTGQYEKNTAGIDDFSNLLTSDQAQRKAREVRALAIPDEFAAVQAKYLKSGGGNYAIALVFSDGTRTMEVTVDGITGMVLEFSGNGVSRPSRTAGKSPQSVAEDYLSRYVPQYKAQLSSPSIYYGEGVTLVYKRMVNGIPFPGNGAYFSIDESGVIQQVSIAWDHLAFPTTKDLLPLEEIYDVFFQSGGLELTYAPYGEQLAPVYRLNAASPGIVHGETGELLGYDGQPVARPKRLNYLNLERHYARDQITALADCNIYVSRGYVDLDAPIRQEDFLLLLSELLPQGKPIVDAPGVLTDDQWEVLSTYFVTSGVLPQDQVDRGGPVTRENAVTYLLRVLGYEEIAKDPSIYRSHFADSEEISPHLAGYVELARGLGLVSGDNGLFCPQDAITNGESMVLIYNYLTHSPAVAAAP